MARMPGVAFLGIADNGTMSAQDIVCVHTIVGYQAGGNAAHFTTGASGKIVQARDTTKRSAANLNGNYRVIAIENEDHGTAYGAWSGSNVPRFTAAQAEAIAKIFVWAHRAHNIPLALVPDSKPGRRGIAYHRQGVDPYRVAGGELWSSSYGKVCPGDKRIAQLINEILPRARALAGGATTSPEDEMTTEQWTKLTEELAFHRRALVENQTRINEANAALGQLKTAVAALATTVSTLSLGGGTVDYTALARAVNDDAARRLAE